MRNHNGHRSIAAWRVYTWLTNDPTLHGAALHSLREAVKYRDTLKSAFLKRRPLEHFAAPILLKMLPDRTPDHMTRYTRLNIQCALEVIKELEAMS